MALTLLLGGLLTAELVMVGYRQELDRVLTQELAEIRLGLPVALAAAAGADQVTSGEEVDLAVRRYLAVQPGSARHLTVITVDGRSYSTAQGPAEVLRLERSGGLPRGPSGLLVTAASPAGDLRLLSAPVVSNGRQIGTVVVVGPLSEGQAQARNALARVAIAESVGLVAGGTLLALVLRRALRPVRQLAEAARSVDLADLDTRIPEPVRQDEVAVMAQEFNRMLDRISIDERQRQRLLAAVSHELRTPLAVASGHLELFETLGPRPGYTALDTAALLRRELDRLRRIVDDLTAVTQGDPAGATAHDPVFVPDVFDTLRGRLAGLSLDQVHIDDPPPAVLLGDEDRLAQALLNLVLNAATHAPQAGRVTVSGHLDHGRVVLQVADDGPGIDPDVLPRVFEPFVSTKPGGIPRTSGLGLAVVKAVTEAQGGKVSIRSGPRGTTVTLSFPSTNPPPP